MLKFLAKFSGPWGWILGHLQELAIASLIALISWKSYSFGVDVADARWTKKEATRVAEQAVIDGEHRREVKELDDALAALETRNANKKTARTEEYRVIDSEVVTYVETIRPAGSGLVTDIGDDGVRLINKAIRSRHAGDRPAKGQS